MNAMQLVLPEDYNLLGAGANQKTKRREKLNNEVEERPSYYLEKMIDDMYLFQKKLCEIAKSTNHQNIVKQISQSGNQISNQIAISCSVIVGEMSRKKELEEQNQFDRLQWQIMELEDRLIQLGVLEKVYKNMQVPKIPKIDMEEKQLEIVVAIFRENPNGYIQFKNEIYRTCCHPIEILKKQSVEFFRGRGYDYYIKINGSTIEIDFNDLKIERKQQENGKKEILCCNGKEYVLDIPYDENYGDFHGFITSYCKTIRMKMDDNLSQEIFRYWVQKSDNMAEKEWEFSNFLESVNRKIELQNLHNLCTELMENVRKYRRKG